MYMKVFPHGQGSGAMPTRYLTRTDYPGRDEQPPEVLRGDPELTALLRGGPHWLDRWKPIFSLSFSSSGGL